MFRKFIEWVMDKPKEWLSKPRLIPALYHDIPEGDPRFVMSQEFADPEHRNLRHYMAAIKDNPSDDYWQMTLVSRDLKHGDDYFETNRRRIADNAEEVIYYLKEFERSCREKKYIPINRAGGTYRKFANLYGLHFDASGNAFRMDVEKTLDKDTLLSREALDKIFQHASEKPKPLDNWEQLYARIVDTSPVENVTLADLAQDPAWNDFAKQAKGMMGKLGELGAYLNSDDTSTSSKTRTLGNMIDYMIVDPTNFENSAKMKLAQHLVDTTVMVGLLRAGAEVYAHQLSKDLSPEVLSFVGKVGEACSRFAEVHFNLSEEQAKPIATIITLGADPHGDKLPLEATLAQYPAQIKKPANDTAPDQKPATASKQGGPKQG